MKPKPTPSIQAATAWGSSAEPHWLVAERLPCLATRQPAPAATNPAVVETLNVGRPPPVPAVSTRASPASTRTASARMVRARPATSCTVSPFARSAIRNAADCASEAFPSMTSTSTRAASSALRSAPLASLSIASVRTGLGKEISQHPLAVGRQHRLGVELHSLDGKLPVAQAHDHVARVGGGNEVVRQLRLHDQRVVATC